MEIKNKVQVLKKKEVKVVEEKKEKNPGGAKTDI